MLSSAYRSASLFWMISMVTDWIFYFSSLFSSLVILPSWTPSGHLTTFISKIRRCLCNIHFKTYATRSLNISFLLSWNSKSNQNFKVILSPKIVTIRMRKPFNLCYMLVINLTRLEKIAPIFVPKKYKRFGDSNN